MPRLNRQAIKDKANLKALRDIHQRHPSYGCRRLALTLNWSTKKTRRLMNMTDIRPQIKSVKRSYVKRQINPNNYLKPYLRPKDETRPRNGHSYEALTRSQLSVWSQDFTTIILNQHKLYLAVILDVQTKLVVGSSLSLNHSRSLVIRALRVALKEYPPPKILHSDQGVEYLSQAMKLMAEAYGIQLSCSDKASPYQNCFVESWFSNFKREVKLTSTDLGQIYETIMSYVNYYNHYRLHTTLKTTPYAYYLQNLSN